MEERLEALEKRVAVLEAEIERERENGWNMFVVAESMRIWPPCLGGAEDKQEARKQEYLHRLTAVESGQPWRTIPSWSKTEIVDVCGENMLVRIYDEPIQPKEKGGGILIGETEDGIPIYHYDAEALASIITRSEAVRKANCGNA